jgi:gamma-glutamyltranspeptidase/glutathione hydrolase
MAWPNRGTAHRPVVMGTRGLVTSASALASMAGVRILLAGGNAVDAAVATAAALSVCEPYMSGPGGSGYLLLSTARDRRVRILDYCGPAPWGANPEAFATLAEKDTGPKAATVPGALAGWLTALATAGTLDPATVFAPAIEYAERGVPVTLLAASFTAAASQRLTPGAREIYCPGGQPPVAGMILRNPQLAATYRQIATEGLGAFYGGSLGRRFVEAIAAQGGLLAARDLEDWQPEWQEPVSTTYRDYRIVSVPPPGQGFQCLQTLNILEGFDLAAAGQNSAETIHLLAEALKLAVADRVAYAGRPDLPISGLLSKDYAAQRRGLIDRERAQRSEGERFGGLTGPDVIAAGNPFDFVRECTTHFDVVDAEGNAVSVTQSLGAFYGSGVLAGDTGIMLNNFLFWAELDPASPVVVAPRKRLGTRMSPTAIFHDDRLLALLGTPGSFGIPQTTTQMISNLLDHGYSIQAAIEAPRIRTYTGTTLEIEGRVPTEVRDELTRRGHDLRVIPDWSPLVGGGQGLMIDPESGAFMGGADPRRDGYAIAI